MALLLLYLTTVLIWGTTWIAIKFQLGEVPLEVSIFYRFALASALLLVYCKIRGLNLKFKGKEHLLLLLLGLCMFSVHLLFVYKSSAYLISGLVSTIFSLVSFFNIFNSFLFFKKRPEVRMVLGACLGFLGVFLFFWDEVRTLSFGSQAIIGTGYGLLGAFVFSLGTIVSRRNQRPLIPSAAIAMGYGACIMFLYSLSQGSSFILPTNGAYWGSLLHLVLSGSIIGFLFYLSLVARLGPERAGYITVFFPVVALLISVLFENYRLTLFDLSGIACVLGGNVLVMAKKKQPVQNECYD
jgi:drug/metabolite transporter (DMT)-like permease